MVAHVADPPAGVQLLGHARLGHAVLRIVDDEVARQKRREAGMIVVNQRLVHLVDQRQHGRDLGLPRGGGYCRAGGRPFGRGPSSLMV